MDDSAIERAMLTTLTCDIVAAHVGHNRVAADELPDLIRAVYGAFATLAAPKPESDGTLVPAVSIRSSVKPDHVTCLECGKQLSMLKRHLRVEHDLQPEEYRARWGLSRNHPLIAPNYAERRGAIAKQIGLGRSRKSKAVAETAVEQQDAPQRSKLALRF